MYGHTTPWIPPRQGWSPQAQAAHTEPVASRVGASEPLWAQVLADLRVRIADHEFVDRFPGDLELVAHYGVSRHTVREAVRHLQVEGILERRRGLGSFVTGTRIEQPVGTLYSLFRSLEEQGIVQESVVRYLEERYDEGAATRLGCPGQPLLYIERLRLGDGQPIALDCSWLPLSLAAPLVKADFRHTALYQQLSDQCGIVPTGGWERIRPVLPGRVQRELLQISGRVPVFGIERMALSDDTRVEWRHSLVRGDRFSFVASWTSDDISTGFQPFDRPSRGGPGESPPRHKTGRGVQTVSGMEP
jgi:GntR family transcriptional regulator